MSYFNSNLRLAATRLLLVVSCVVVNLQQLSGQSTQVIDKQIKFSLSGLLYDNLELNHNATEILKSKMCPSSEVTISYYQHINKCFGINIGAGFTIAPFNINYHYKSPNNQPYIGEISEDFLNHYIYIQDMYSVPVSLQYKFKSKRNEKHTFSTELGIKFNRKVAFPYQTTTQVWYDLNDTTEIVLYDFSLSNTKKRNFLSYFFKIGIIKNTKRLNSYQINLTLHFSPVKLGTGTYNFYYLPVISNGSVKENVNYIGFEFTYGLSFKKKQIE